MTKSTYWVGFESLQFLNRLFVTLRPDEPVNKLIPEIFTQITRKMMFFGGYTHGVHILSNAISSGGEAASTLELDHLYMGKEVCDHGYCRNTLDGHTALGGYNDLKDLVSTCPPCFSRTHLRARWDLLFRHLFQARFALAYPKLDWQASEVLMIPLSQPSPKLPAGLLGTIVLWNNRASGLPRPRTEQLILTTKLFSDFVYQLLTTHFDVTSDTYLPSYRRPGEHPVAVLFADIRNFTTVSEILRNVQLVAEWTKFMLGYSETMCNVVREGHGRVLGMTGDGIIAVFGEYSSDHRSSAQAAVRAAQAMLGAFGQIKQEFLEGAEIAKFFREKYEPLEFDIGIGVNFGTVMFDYFGAAGSRFYGASGDHINFAQRLESEASRFDLGLKRDRGPILVSRPVWELLSEPAWPAIVIEVKDKPYKYRAYECPKA